MKIALIGDSRLGGVQMRGKAVAEAAGWQFVDLLRDSWHSREWDVLIAVKYTHFYGEHMREAAKILIWDPLDCWAGKDLDMDIFWQTHIQRLKADAVLATSPAAAASMLQPEIPVYMCPHHADPLLRPAGGDSIVYCGARRYVESAAEAISEAVRRLGDRGLLWTTDPVLTGHARLILHPRLSPHNYPLNLHCKPQVKLENAAAVGARVLATPDPCVLSCRTVPTLPEADWHDPDKLEVAIRAALESEPLANPVTLADHVQRLKDIIRELTGEMP